MRPFAGILAAPRRLDAGGGARLENRRKAAVIVVRNPSVARGCDFLGACPARAPRKKVPYQTECSGKGVAEMGGDTLLLLAAGSGEAYRCGGGSPRIYVDSPPRCTSESISKLPTPRATPRYAR
jgi:hypothetical protein